MTTPRSTQDKSGKPEGVEDKALSPATEDKALSPAVEGKAAVADGVQLVLSTHYEYAGEHYLPGDPISLPGDVADSLVIGGFATRA